MAAVTVTGSASGTPISFGTSTAIQTSMAQSILSAAMVGSQIVPAGGGTISSTYAVVTGAGVVTGSSVTGGSVLLTAPGAVFFAGGVATATTIGTPVTTTVVAADNVGAAIVNSNPTGALVAITGAGGNFLDGAAGQNAFTTGIGGQDLVFLNGAANSLTSNGADAVLVGGPSTITAASNGADVISMTAPTTLNFINGSKAGVVDSITGATGSTIALAGTGATSITSGIGASAFNVDTSAGNVTLNGSFASGDTFEFSRVTTASGVLTAGTANVTVNNAAANDSILIKSNLTDTVTAGNAGTVVALSDGSSVTFTNLTVSQVNAIIKPSAT